jgi:hypothetical protein
MTAGTLEQRRRVEFGDFQTPPALAEAVCRALGVERPVTLIEPTCGTGAFLAAALDCFPRLRVAMGFDVNPRYVAAARRRVARSSSSAVRRVRVADFFQVDWPAVLAECAGPVLILGNPPWVTNSALGMLGSGNLPPKQNLPGRSGLEGLTGKSNFDVSEWMIWRLLEAAAGRPATLALLCKTAVARRVLARAWEQNLPIGPCEIRVIDSARHFGVRVEACLLICRSASGRSGVPECPVADRLEAASATGAFGWRDGRLIADVDAYERVKYLLGGQARWRSGVKHDCSAVFEFREEHGQLVNSLGEAVDLEPDYLYPLVKSSDVSMLARAGSRRGPRPRGGRHMLVPQRRVGEETDSIAARAPKTWRYLERHAPRLDRRASRVYQKQPRFSIFGVGHYTFTPWKVAVSGFYKKPQFAPIGPRRGRPVICDDTCYFFPCKSAATARSLARLLNGPVARDFFDAFCFSDAKRPLTAEILGLLDLAALPREV